jgi:hypothetical protein
MSTIMLSRKAVDRIAKLCSKVKFNNPHNEHTIEMADGIAVFVQLHRYVSYEQAVWLCRNFDHWNVKRPRELANIVVTSIAKYLR